MLKDKLVKTVDDATTKIQQFVDKNGEDILICVGLAAGLTFGGTLLLKIIPSRTNVHLYFHIN